MESFPQMTMFPPPHPLDGPLREAMEQWQIMHNARADPTFRILPDGYDSKTPAQMKSVAQTMKRAYWNGLETEMVAKWDDGVAFGRVFEKVVEFMDSVAALFSKASKARQDELFKPMVEHCYLMQTQLREKKYDVASFATTLRIIVDSLLAQLESPYQFQLTQSKFTAAYYADQFTSERKKEDAAATIVDALRYVFEKLDACKAETRNVKLAMLSPAQKAMNERIQFDKVVAQFAGRHPFFEDKVLKRVLKEARAAEKTEGSVGQLGAAPLSEIAFFTDEEALFRFLAGLLFSPDSLSNDDLPLPLRCQFAELHEMQSDLQRATLLAVLGTVLQMQVQKAAKTLPKLQRVLKKDLEAEKRMEAVGLMTMNSFFAKVKKLLQDQSVDRKTTLSELEDGLTQLLLDSTQERESLEPEEILEISGVAGQALEQFSEVTKKGTESPIFQLLMKRMKGALVPTADFEGAMDPKGINFVFPDRGVNFLTVNAPQAEKSPTKTGVERGAVATAPGMATSEGEVSEVGSQGVRTTFGDAGYGSVPAMSLSRPRFSKNEQSALVFLRQNAPSPRQPTLSPRPISAGLSLPLGQLSPRSPGAFPSPGDPSPAHSERSVSSAPGAAAALLLAPRASLRERPTVAGDSFGDKPWFLGIAGQELYEAELRLSALVGAHWMIYKTWYHAVPVVVLK